MTASPLLQSVKKPFLPVKLSKQRIPGNRQVVSVCLMHAKDRTFEIRIFFFFLNNKAVWRELNNDFGYDCKSLHKWMDWCLIVPTGHFLLEPWDIKKLTHSPHLGVTVTVRDPNHEVVHTQESYITTETQARWFLYSTKAKLGWGPFNSITQV